MNNKKNIIAIIPARGGSKGIPNKNIIDCMGKPLIAHSIEYAKESDLVTSIYVSTDDAKIAEVAKQYGAEIIECKDIMHGKIDEITHFGHPIFKGIEKKFLATRYHSLIINKKTLPNNFDIISSAKNDIIMGIAHKKHKIYGLQFHPESIGTKTGKLILQNFLKIINYES